MAEVLLLELECLPFFFFDKQHKRIHIVELFYASMANIIIVPAYCMFMKL